MEVAYAKSLHSVVCAASILGEKLLKCCSNWEYFGTVRLHIWGGDRSERGKETHTVEKLYELKSNYTPIKSNNKNSYWF